jgi:LAGLIDADG endonuclease
MPGLVGGFGNSTNLLKIFRNNNPINNFKYLIKQKSSLNNLVNSNLGSYLAGLIEGDGTFAIQNIKSTTIKYRPKIIVVFKKADLPLAQYLKNITNCGKVYIKSDRGYILWQIQDIVGVFTIVNLINGYMRTPKIEALERTINWLNEYILTNQFSKLPSTNLIISKIHHIEPKSLDNSSIDSNSWFSGFSDADANFSINIHKRYNKNSMRVQLYYRLEIKQTYHKLDSDNKKVSFFSIMSKLGKFLGVNILSRSRIKDDKQYYSYTIMAHNKNSLSKIKEYFSKFPLLSSKYLDFKDWLNILKLQEDNPMTTSYLDKAINTRKNFNRTRTTYNWDHLNDCYLTKK